MALATYFDLVGAIGDWLINDALVGRASDFVTLAEARLNRLLSDPDMEVRATLAGTGQYTALPADFGELVGVTTGNYRLSQVSGAEMTALRPRSGEPYVFAVVDGMIAFAPSQPSSQITLLYRQRIPPLSPINPVNWLLTRAPDAYLYGALVQAAAFIADDERVGMWKAAFDEAIAELRSDGDRRRWGAAPIAPRLGRT